MQSFRPLIIFMYIFIFINISFAEITLAPSYRKDLNSNGNYEYFIFDENHYEYYEKAEILFEGSYVVKRIGSIPFIELIGMGEFIILGNDHYLFLYNKNTKEPFFWGENSYTTLHPGIQPPENFSSSSNLVEENRIYPVTDLIKIDLQRSWVEGVPGWGIGETVSFEIIDVPAADLYISNGFVSAEHPEFYDQNGRVKEIELYCEETDDYLSFELQDIPDPQTIELPIGWFGKITLKILSVYEGTTYEDTCLNFILCRYHFYEDRSPDVDYDPVVVHETEISENQK